MAGQPKRTRSDSSGIQFLDHAELHDVELLKNMISRASKIISSDQPRTPEDEPIIFKAMHGCGWLASQPKTRRPIKLRRIQAERLHERIMEYLVNQNIGLIYEMRRRSAVRDIDRDDLFSEGLWTLYRSVVSFNPWKGYKFSTYACTSILRAFTALSNRERREAARVRKADELSRAEANRTAPLELGSQILVEQLKLMLADKDGVLTPLERFVLDRRLLQTTNGRSETLESIGHMIQFSKERVRQIQISAIAKLRSAILTPPPDSSVDYDSTVSPLDRKGDLMARAIELRLTGAHAA